MATRSVLVAASDALVALATAVEAAARVEKAFVAIIVAHSAHGGTLVRDILAARAFGTTVSTNTRLVAPGHACLAPALACFVLILASMTAVAVCLSSYRLELSMTTCVAYGRVASGSFEPARCTRRAHAVSRRGWR